MTLYKELDSDILLIVDNRAKKYAVLNDVRVIGSLGILIKAKEQNHIDKIKPLLDEIRKSEVYISDKLILQVLEICNEVKSCKWKIFIGLMVLVSFDIIWLESVRYIFNV